MPLGYPGSKVMFAGVSSTFVVSTIFPRFLLRHRVDAFTHASAQRNQAPGASRTIDVFPSTPGTQQFLATYYWTNGSFNLETSYRRSPLLSYIQDSVVFHMHICARITEAGLCSFPTRPLGRPTAEQGEPAAAAYFAYLGPN
ncbi:hypothetical protein PG991_008043 [Apiospora marii]|uniref:Uncharacterized protein n=1 Tax=Apiospora marii TaxID=335849 RepID=A0ABR1RV55_9PEZI